MDIDSFRFAKFFVPNSSPSLTQEVLTMNLLNSIHLKDLAALKECLIEKELVENVVRNMLPSKVVLLGEYLVQFILEGTHINALWLEALLKFHRKIIVVSMEDNENIRNLIKKLSFVSGLEREISFFQGKANILFKNKEIEIKKKRKIIIEEVKADEKIIKKPKNSKISMKKKKIKKVKKAKPTKAISDSVSDSFMDPDRNMVIPDLHS